MTVPLWQSSATSLAEAIRAKQLSSQDFAREHLDRIRAVNDQVNAITVVLEDDAMRGARAADQRIASGDAVGPLHGVPITIKENIDLVGSATTHGLVGLKDSMAATDAPVVAHLKAAGAVPVGRANLPDLGMRWHTDNDLWGATRNPWDPARTPGGSSGGEAVALATGMSPLGVGNDVAGSLRYPAQCCGITAVRPTLGRVSPFEVGFDLAGWEQLRHFMRSIRLTEACSLLGLPSVAVPVGVVDGLPQAVQSDRAALP